VTLFTRTRSVWVWASSASVSELRQLVSPRYDEDGNATVPFAEAWELGDLDEDFVETVAARELEAASQGAELGPTVRAWLDELAPGAGTLVLAYDYDVTPERPPVLWQPAWRAAPRPGASREQTVYLGRAEWMVRARNPRWL
jgi:hypothetical protein